jgi:hypothetical protein
MGWENFTFTLLYFTNRNTYQVFTFSKFGLTQNKVIKIISFRYLRVEMKVEVKHSPINAMNTLIIVRGIPRCIENYDTIR